MSSQPHTGIRNTWSLMLALRCFSIDIGFTNFLCLSTWLCQVFNQSINQSINRSINQSITVIAMIEVDEWSCDMTLHQIHCTLPLADSTNFRSERNLNQINTTVRSELAQRGNADGDLFLGVAQQQFDFRTPQSAYHIYRPSSPSTISHVAK